MSLTLSLYHASGGTPQRSPDDGPAAKAAAALAIALVCGGLAAYLALRATRALTPEPPAASPTFIHPGPAPSTALTDPIPVVPPAAADAGQAASSADAAAALVAPAAPATQAPDFGGAGVGGRAGPSASASHTLTAGAIPRSPHAMLAALLATMARPGHAAPSARPAPNAAAQSPPHRVALPVHDASVMPIMAAQAAQAGRGAMVPLGGPAHRPSGLDGTMMRVRP